LNFFDFIDSFIWISRLQNMTNKNYTNRISFFSIIWNCFTNCVLWIVMRTRMEADERESVCLVCWYSMCLPSLGSTFVQRLFVHLVDMKIEFFVRRRKRHVYQTPHSRHRGRHDFLRWYNWTDNWTECE
jgi:hypothetical protein